VLAAPVRDGSGVSVRRAGGRPQPPAAHFIRNLRVSDGDDVSGERREWRERGSGKRVKGEGRGRGERGER